MTSTCDVNNFLLPDEPVDVSLEIYLNKIGDINEATMVSAAAFLYAQGPLLLTWINIIITWISNHNHYTVWDEITYPSSNFNDAAVEVCERIRNFIPRDYLPMLARFKVEPY